MKSKSTTVLLAFFLGGIGVHRFYLGQTGKGFVYLIFCWTLIPALIAFIDFIVFLSMSEFTFNAKYNRTITVNVQNQQQIQPQNKPSIAAELERLTKLREQNLINDHDLELAKAKLLQ